MDLDSVGLIRRSAFLLRLLATAGKRGLALTELSAKSNLPHSTVHRLLKQLSAEGLTFQSLETRRYLLGPLAYELGLAASDLFDFRSLCQPIIRRIAQSTEDTVYLVLRSGFDAVCLDRIDGTFPIRTITLDVGSRRPLGIGAGGLAILAACDKNECRRIVHATEAQLGEVYKLTSDDQFAAVAETRAQGFSLVQNRLSLGVTAVGLAFCDSMNQPVGAISIAGVQSRMSSTRRENIVTTLRNSVSIIERAIREQRPIFVSR